jgi:hypothetical protein
MRKRRPLFGASEEPAQFFFGPREDAFLFLRQRVARAVDVEVQHRHGRAERRGFTPVACLRGMFERSGNPGWIAPGKDSGIQIHRIAGFGNVLRPSTTLTHNSLPVGLLQGACHYPGGDE